MTSKSQGQTGFSLPSNPDFNRFSLDSKLTSPYILPQVHPPQTIYGESSCASNVVSHDLHYIIRLQAQARVDLSPIAGTYFAYSVKAEETT